MYEDNYALQYRLPEHIRCFVVYICRGCINEQAQDVTEECELAVSVNMKREDEWKRRPEQNFHSWFCPKRQVLEACIVVMRGKLMQVRSRSIWNNVANKGRGSTMQARGRPLQQRNVGAGGAAEHSGAKPTESRPQESCYIHTKRSLHILQLPHMAI